MAALEARMAADSGVKALAERRRSGGVKELEQGKWEEDQQQQKEQEQDQPTQDEETLVGGRPGSPLGEVEAARAKIKFLKPSGYSGTEVKEWNAKLVAMPTLQDAVDAAVEEMPAHAAAGLLSLTLREMREPLLPTRAHDALVRSVEASWEALASRTRKLRRKRSGGSKASEGSSPPASSRHSRKHASTEGGEDSGGGGEDAGAFPFVGFGDAGEGVGGDFVAGVAGEGL